MSFRDSNSIDGKINKLIQNNSHNSHNLNENNLISSMSSNEACERRKFNHKQLLHKKENKIVSPNNSSCLKFVLRKNKSLNSNHLKEEEKPKFYSEKDQIELQLERDIYFNSNDFEENLIKTSEYNKDLHLDQEAEPDNSVNLNLNLNLNIEVGASKLTFGRSQSEDVQCIDSFKDNNSNNCGDSQVLQNRVSKNKEINTNFHSQSSQNSQFSHKDNNNEWEQDKNEENNQVNNLSYSNYQQKEQSPIMKERDVKLNVDYKNVHEEEADDNIRKSLFRHNNGENFNNQLQPEINDNLDSIYKFEIAENNKQSEVIQIPTNKQEVLNTSNNCEIKSIYETPSGKFELDSSHKKIEKLELDEDM